MNSHDWGSMNPTTFMSNEGERLRIAEHDIVNLQRADTDKEQRIRSIEQTIWKAFGASAVLQLGIVIVVEWTKK